MELLVKKLTVTAKLPTKAYSKDAGYDLYSDQDITIIKNSVSRPTPYSVAVATGIAVAIPEGYWGLIKPRSGYSVKYGVDALAGVVDAGFRSEVKVIISSIKPFNIEKGDRIAQMIILPVVELPLTEVEELPDSERGKKGFGSSGR